MQLRASPRLWGAWAALDKNLMVGKQGPQPAPGEADPLTLPPTHLHAPIWLRHHLADDCPGENSLPFPGVWSSAFRLKSWVCSSDGCEPTGLALIKVIQEADCYIPSGLSSPQVFFFSAGKSFLYFFRPQVPVVCIHHSWCKWELHSNCLSQKRNFFSAHFVEIPSVQVTGLQSGPPSLNVLFFFHVPLPCVGHCSSRLTSNEISILVENERASLLIDLSELQYWLSLVALGHVPIPEPIIETLGGQAGSCAHLVCGVLAQLPVLRMENWGVVSIRRGK